MKRILSLCLAFVCLLSLISCGGWDPVLEGQSWVLEQAIEAESETVTHASADLIAQWGGAYAEVTAIECTLRAKDGRIEIRDVTNDKTFLGEYSDYELITAETADYSLKFGVRRGKAVVQWFTDAVTEKSEKLLTVTLGGYTLVFTAE